MDEQEKLHNLVEALQLTPYQFSKSLGYDRPDAIYKVLNGKTVNPGISLYVKIKQTFPQVRYEYLMYGKVRLERIDRKVHWPQ